MATTLSIKDTVIYGISERLGLYTLPPYINTVVFWALFYYSIYAYLGPFFLKHLAPFNYSALSDHRRLLWIAWTTSISQSAINASLAIYLMFRQEGVPQTPQERLLGYSPQISSVLAVATGYFWFHVYHDIRDYHIHGKLMVIHAIVALITISLGFKPLSLFYTRFFLIWELPNFFLNIQRWLDATGRKQSYSRTVNRFVLLASYFGARIVLGVYCTYSMGVDMIALYQDPLPRPRVRPAFLAPVFSHLKFSGPVCFLIDSGTVCEVPRLNPLLAVLQLGSLMILSLQGFYWFTIIWLKKGDNNQGYVGTRAVNHGVKVA